MPSLTPPDPMTVRIEPYAAEIAFWVGLCAALGVFLGAQTDWGRQIQPPLPDIHYAALIFDAPKLDDPPKFNAPDQYIDMVERPLFVVTRRPPPPPPPPAVPVPTMRKGQFRLAGVSIIGDNKVAFLLETATGKTKAVREGQSINELTVAKISPETVTLAQFGDSEEIPLKVIVAAQLPKPTPLPPGVQPLPPAQGAPPAQGGPPPIPPPPLGAAMQRADQLQMNR
jgi:hypothetical protein